MFNLFKKVVVFIFLYCAYFDSVFSSDQYQLIISEVSDGGEKTGVLKLKNQKKISVQQDVTSIQRVFTFMQTESLEDEVCHAGMVSYPLNSNSFQQSRKNSQKKSGKQKKQQKQQKHSIFTNNISQMKSVLSLDVDQSISTSIAEYSDDSIGIHTAFNNDGIIADPDDNTFVIDVLQKLTRPKFKTINKQSFISTLNQINTAPLNFRDMLFSVTQEWTIQAVYMTNVHDRSFLDFVGLRITSPISTNVEMGISNRVDLLLQINSAHSYRDSVQSNPINITGQYPRSFSDPQANQLRPRSRVRYISEPSSINQTRLLRPSLNQNSYSGGSSVSSNLSGVWFNANPSSPSTDEYDHVSFQSSTGSYSSIDCSLNTQPSEGSDYNHITLTEVNSPHSSTRQSAANYDCLDFSQRRASGFPVRQLSRNDNTDVDFVSNFRGLSFENPLNNNIEHSSTINREDTDANTNMSANEHSNKQNRLSRKVSIKQRKTSVKKRTTSASANTRCRGVVTDNEQNLSSYVDMNNPVVSANRSQNAAEYVDMNNPVVSANRSQDAAEYVDMNIPAVSENRSQLIEEQENVELPNRGLDLTIELQSRIFDQ